MPKKDLPIHTVADDRERQYGASDALAGFKPIQVCTRPISIGDYQIDNRLLIERKTLRDFAVSIIDGSLFEQMICLANSAFREVLILEGTIKDAIDIGVTREAMQVALITVSLILGIPMLRSKDPLEAAKPLPTK